MGGVSGGPRGGGGRAAGASRPPASAARTASCSASRLCSARMYSTAERSVSTLLSFLLAPPCGTCCRSAWKPKFTSFTRLRSRSLRRATAAAPPPASADPGRRRRLQRSSSGDVGLRRTPQAPGTAGEVGTSRDSAPLSIAPASTRLVTVLSPGAPQESAQQSVGSGRPCLPGASGTPLPSDSSGALFQSPLELEDGVAQESRGGGQCAPGSVGRSCPARAGGRSLGLPLRGAGGSFLNV